MASRDWHRQAAGSTSAGLAAAPRLQAAGAGSRRLAHSSLLREGVAVSGAADFMPTSRVMRHSIRSSANLSPSHIGPVSGSRSPIS
jgi:hypothetical protein